MSNKVKDSRTRATSEGVAETFPAEMNDGVGCVGMLARGELAQWARARGAALRGYVDPRAAIVVGPTPRRPRPPIRRRNDSSAPSEKRDGVEGDLLGVHEVHVSSVQREGAVLFMADVALDAVKRRTTSASSSANAIVISPDEWTGLVAHFSDVLAIACAYHLDVASGRLEGR